MGRPLMIGNPPIAVDVRRSKQARRLSLRVSRLDGKVGLTLPYRASEAQAHSFLKQKEPWLRQQLDRLQEPRQVCVGATIPFLGREHEIVLGDGRIVIADDESICVPRTKKSIGSQVQGFLKTRARVALAEASNRYSEQLGVSYSKITMRDTRSRWGSCTGQGGLMYSWRLIMAPPDVLDYVAAHEVAHLVEMNHSPAFWAVVERLRPDFSQHRQWLKTNGADLHRIDFGN